MDKLALYNRKAWDNAPNTSFGVWATPVSKEEVDEARRGVVKIRLTPRKFVPPEWLPELKGKRVLCLASGGGQQGPIMAAAGADVTVLDNSPRQLQQDELVAERDGLSIKTELGDVRDLSRFPDEHFDLVINLGAGHIEDLNVMWREIGGVVKDRGVVLSGFVHAFECIFDLREWRKGNLVVRHSIPFSEIRDLSEEEKKELIVDQGEPFFFSNSFEDQMQGQIDAGFVIVGVYEDENGGPLEKYIKAGYATRAVKTRIG